MGRLPKRFVRREAAKVVDRLIEASLKAVSKDQALGENYLDKARRVCERYRIRKPPLLRRLYCRRCKRPIFPGRTSKFRIRRGRGKHLSITCLLCGSVTRIPLDRPKQGV
ncbi:MAG: hypothetical protein JTT11_00175 [Candidatus Brockarchaeota archaeon]|nr:hypothetical protein [Candidatus Brockarchaeota archaeon]